MNDPSSEHSTRVGEFLYIIDLAQIEDRLNSCRQASAATSSGFSQGTSHTSDAGGAGSKFLQQSDVSDACHSLRLGEDAGEPPEAMVGSDVSDGNQTTLNPGLLFDVNSTCLLSGENSQTTDDGITNVRTIPDQSAGPSDIA